MAKKGTYLTEMQEKFCLNLFQGMSQREAWIKAGYSSNYALSKVDSNACVMANTSKIQGRLAELRKKAEEESVATVLERKKICTAGMRGELKDVIVTKYPDGSTVTTIRTAARGPFISEINKMERIYGDNNINIAIIHAKPIDEYSEEELDAIIEGKCKLIEGEDQKE